MEKQNKYDYYSNQIQPVLVACRGSKYKGMIKFQQLDTSSNWLALPTPILQKIADIILEYGNDPQETELAKDN